MRPPTHPHAHARMHVPSRSIPLAANTPANVLLSVWFCPSPPPPLPPPRPSSDPGRPWPAWTALVLICRPMFGEASGSQLRGDGQCISMGRLGAFFALHLFCLASVHRIHSKVHGIAAHAHLLLTHARYFHTFNYKCSLANLRFWLMLNSMMN